MRFSHLALGGIAMMAVVVAPVSPASANCYYRHCHHFSGGPIGAVFGLAGAVVVGAATIATAPLVVAGDILTGPSYGPAYPAYGPAYSAYGPAYDGAYRYSYRDDTFYRVRYYGPRYYRRYDRPRYAYGY